MSLYPETENLIKELEAEWHLIEDNRKLELEHLAGVILENIQEFNRADVTVVCTHNSRRSHLGQLWLKAAAMHYGIQNIFTYSGGTEATAFNHRMVLAIKRAGFKVNQLDMNDNPKFYIPVSDNDYRLDIHFSKRYDESYNPQKNFIALMVCSQADEACPVVVGGKRFSLPYQDPKDYDDTVHEAGAYDMKLREMGREILYMVSKI